jgi:4-carboxymuconolactone decarboxylase
MKSGDVSFEEMDELALQFAAYFGWPKGSYLNQVIGEQKLRVSQEAAEAGVSAQSVRA